MINQPPFVTVGIENYHYEDVIIEEKDQDNSEKEFKEKQKVL